jgi:soluble lytic murein transglycosylase-like protein
VSSVLPTVIPTYLIIAPFFTREVQYWVVEIDRWAREYGLDPNLIATIMQVESCGSPTVESRAGAIGLFQVMPFHFRASEDSLDPDTNAHRGMIYLVRALELAGGDVGLASAGYNGGHGVIGLSEERWSAETLRYRYFVEGIYGDAAAGLSESDRLTTWYTNYGVDLCQKTSRELGLSEPTLIPTSTPTH